VQLGTVQHLPEAPDPAAGLHYDILAVQGRLKDKPLVDYISPFGVGYSGALPSLKGSRFHVHSDLVSPYL
jgi:hypothetical protein